MTRPATAQMIGMKRLIPVVVHLQVLYLDKSSVVTMETPVFPLVSRICFDTSAMLLVAADVCDENHYMDCTNGWDESNCALGSEGEQFYLGSILNWQFRIQCI